MGKECSEEIKTKLQHNNVAFITELPHLLHWTDKKSTYTWGCPSIHGSVLEANTEMSVATSTKSHVGSTHNRRALRWGPFMRWNTAKWTQINYGPVQTDTVLRRRKSTGKSEGSPRPDAKFELETKDLRTGVEGDVWVSQGPADVASVILAVSKLCGKLSGCSSTLEAWFHNHVTL